MKKNALLALFCCAVLSSVAPAQDLKLIPEPRQVQKRDGVFNITSKTRIVINSAHATEDHLAAEVVADEIEAASGFKLKIGTVRSAPKSGAIYLARVGDDKALASSLDAGKLAIDGDFNDEGYALEATNERVVIAARTGQGLFYGAQTLRQLILQRQVPVGAQAPVGAQVPVGARTPLGARASRPHPAALVTNTAGETPALPGAAALPAIYVPAVAIKDWPEMRWRGVHDDISRGPVPTLDYIKKQIRTCAAYKLNLFSLYIEHVFDYKSHPLIGPPEGSLNAAEVKELVEYARRYHVTLLPEQQAFGHLHHVLKNEVYNDLAETPHGHVLAPVNEKSYELIKDLYSELVPLFPGPLFHIGSDETFELGQGQTKTRVAEVGLGRVYLEHLRRVAEMMKPYNKRLMFWGDIAIKYPELLNILPKDVIAVAWNYWSQRGFDPMLKPYRDAGLDIFVSPGANNWNRIFPDLDLAFLNIKGFVSDGQKYGALGMLNTTWDDDGEALFGMTWPAIVFGAACSWQQGETSIESFKQKYDWAFYRNDDNTFRDAIQNLARTHSILREAKAGASAYDEAFWEDPFTEAGSKRTEKALPAARDLRLAAERALESLYRNRAKARMNADTLDYLVFAAMRLDLLGMKVQFASEISKYYWDAYMNMGDRGRVGRDLNEITSINARLEDLRDSTTRLRGAYADLWLKENRPYWLGNVLVRFDNLASLFQTKIQAVQAAERQYQDDGFLPPPHQLGFYVR